MLFGLYIIPVGFCLYFQMNATASQSPECDDMSYINDSSSNSTNCSMKDGHLLLKIFDENIPTDTTSAQLFFTYFTPVIFLIGLVGNTLSLVVFMSKNMRKLSASIYLAALSMSDLMALIFYVLPEWLKHGLPSLPGHPSAIFLQYNGTCQIMLYLQYIARFLSSWFVVFFTIERFIGVCFPLRRRDICDPKSASRVVLGAIIVASAGCVFKPILSGSHKAINGDPLCASDKDHQYVSFILDSIFGVTITLIPFVLITVLNLLIIRKLVRRNRRHRKIRIVTEESIIRLEFTFILLAISICFVSFNLPYFAVWCNRYWTYRKTSSLDTISPAIIDRHDDHIGDLDEILHVTRTIFYTNYCINFFLYSVTGAYFRKELKHLFMAKQHGYIYSHHCSAYYSRSSTHTTPQSWV